MQSWAQCPMVGDWSLHLQAVQLIISRTSVVIGFRSEWHMQKRVAGDLPRLLNKITQNTSSSFAEHQIQEDFKQAISKRKSKAVESDYLGLKFFFTTTTSKATLDCVVLLCASVSSTVKIRQ